MIPLQSGSKPPVFRSDLDYAKDDLASAEKMLVDQLSGHPAGLAQRLRDYLLRDLRRSVRQLEAEAEREERRGRP